MIPKRTKTFTWTPSPYGTKKDLLVKEENGERLYGCETVHLGEIDVVWLPSVTTILGHFKKKSINEWRNRVGHQEANRISGTAARRGTVIHKMVEKYLMNFSMQSVVEGASLLDIEMFNNILPALDRIDNIIMQEEQLYSLALGTAGRCDLIAEFDGVKSIIDFKTSNKLKQREWIEDYFEQTAGYAAMYEHRYPKELPINNLVVIIANDESNVPQVFQEEASKPLVGLVTKIAEYRKVKCVPSII